MVPRFLVSAMFLILICFGWFALGITNSALAAEPHVCVNNNHISTEWENLGGVTTIYFAAKTCNHSSNTTYWKFTVKNWNAPYQIYCSATNGGNGYAVSAADPYVLSCPSLPINSNARIRVIIDYQVIGSGTWMPHPDLVKNY